MAKYRPFRRFRPTKGLSFALSLMLTFLPLIVFSGPEGIALASASPKLPSLLLPDSSASVSTRAPYDPAPNPIPGQVIVRFKATYINLLYQELATANLFNPDFQDSLIGARLTLDRLYQPLPELAALLAQYDTWAADAIIPDLGAYLLKLNPALDPRATAQSLADSGFFEYAEPDFPVYPFLEPNDPLYPRQQGALQQINAPAAWNITTGNEWIRTGAEPVVIAVVDSGVSPIHPDLIGKVLDKGRNFSVEPANAITSDNYGHGTFVAGIAAANTNDGIGMAGVAWGARILPIKVLDAQGLGTNATIARGIAYAAQKRAQIINISLGGPERSQVVDNAVQQAFGQGAVLVASMGNNGTDQPNYPAALDNVIGVGAFNQQGDPAPFSNYGPELSILAPGTNIIGPWPGPTPYILDSGTSSATPFVAGAAALMVSVNGNLSNLQVRNILEGTADSAKPTDPGVPSLDNSGVKANNMRGSYSLRLGWGRLNLYKAVLAAKQGDYFPNGRGRIQGNIRGIDPGDVQVILQPGTVISPNRITDTSGTYSFSNLPPGDYTLKIESRKFGISRGPETIKFGGSDSEVYTRDYDLSAEVKAAFATGKPIAAFKPFEAPLFNTPTRIFFPATGHSLKDKFLKFWQDSGQLTLFGFPISEEFTEKNPADGNPYTVQYFERAVFEYHPEYAGSKKDEIQLRLLGRESAESLKVGGRLPKAFDPILPPAFQPADSKTPAFKYFYETNHSLRGQFFDYWKARGDSAIAVLGLPISEELFENGRRVQYFERYRLEIHPEDAGTGWEIIGSLLARDAALQRGYLGKPG